MFSIIYLPTITDKFKNKIELVQKFSSSEPVLVPLGYIPFTGYFDDQIFYLMDGIETSVKRSDFQENRAVYDNTFGGYIDDWEYCVRMIPITELQEMGVVIQTGEGWKWDPEGRKYDRDECPQEGFLWNCLHLTWEKGCDKCSKPFCCNEYGEIFSDLFCCCDRHNDKCKYCGKTIDLSKAEDCNRHHGCKNLYE
jgi:hypothetical protein